MAEYKPSNQFFVNPYNFVPVNLEKPGRDDVTQQKNEGMLTGYLQCNIKCKTPLAIPDVEKKMPQNPQDHYKYPFFTVDNQPVIPGSAIRGVIRNVYETLTDSCFGAMQGDVAITARSSESFQPGLLIEDKDKKEWSLYKAKRHLVVVDRNFHRNQGLGAMGINLYNTASLRNFYDSKMGGQIYFNLSNQSYFHEYRKNGEIKQRWIGKYVKQLDKSQKKGWKEGYLYFGEWISKRHFQSIFEHINPTNPKPVSGVTITNYDIQKIEDIIREYRSEKKNRLYNKKEKNNYKYPHQGYPDYEDAKEAGVVPVYYKVQSGKLYMTFATLGRKAYNKTWDDITAEKSHRKCSGRNNLCPACALFGTAEGDKLGSKLRFTDANCINDTKNVIKENVIFAELGSPRMSYVPFYLKEKAGLANANYKDGYDSPDLEIRGRKFYWHHSPEEGKDIEKNNLNATFDVIEKETTFMFRIYFDGITEGQLKLLAMSLHLNENQPDGNMCHKMGHGKPLGYGSVKIFIESCKLRSFDLEKGWKETDRKIHCDVACNCGDATKKAFFAICNFEAAKKFGEAKVEYPEILLDKSYEDKRNLLNENVLAGHQWFTKNYRLGSKKPEKKLPEITDKNMTLEKYTAMNI